MLIVGTGFAVSILILNLVAGQTYWGTISLFFLFLGGKLPSLSIGKWRENRATTLFCLIAFLLIGARIGGIVKDSFEKAPNLLNYQILEGEVVEHEPNQTLITTKKYGKGKLFLTPLQRKNLTNGQTIIFQGKGRQLTKNNNTFYWGARSYNLQGNYYANPKFQIKIHKETSGKQKIRIGLLSQHEKREQAGIKTILFQQKMPSTLNVNGIEQTQILGVYHFFVVSGFHLLIFSGPMRGLMNKGKNKSTSFLGEGLLLIIMGGLVFITNFKITAVKAGFIIVSRIFWRQLPPIKCLAFGFLIFLLYGPLYLLRTGFQISFLASFLLCLKQKRYRNGGKRIGRKSKQIIGITLGLIPILIPFQTGISLTIGFNQIIFLLGSFLFYPLFFLTIGWGIFAKLGRLGFQQTENLIKLLGKYKTVFLIGDGPNGLNIFYYGMFGFCLLKGRRKKELFALLMLVASLFLVGLSNQYRNQQTQIHFINVGHGLAILVKVPERKLNLLFDAGIGKQKISYNRKIWHYLQRERISTLEAVFISHQNTDHYNNFQFLAHRIKVRQTYRFDTAKSQYQINGLTIGNLNFKYAKHHRNQNNQGLVLAMQLKQKGIFLPFDLEVRGEKQLLKNGGLPPITFFQVGHHGSNTSSSPIFLRQVQPEFCFVSNQKQLKAIIKQRLNQFCQKIYTTQKDGHIKAIIMQTGQIRIKTEKRTGLSSLLFG